MDLRLRHFPDPVLLAAATPIATFGPALEALRVVMQAVLREQRGIGLAAPQVGCSQQLIVVDQALGRGPAQLLWLCNPRLVWHQGVQISTEGCLSLPGRTCRLKRPKRVRVAFQTLDGTLEQRDFQGLATVCVLHEMDHLDGILMSQRSPLQLALPSPRLTNAPAA